MTITLTITTIITIIIIIIMHLHAALLRVQRHVAVRVPWAALVVERYLSNAASFVSCAFDSVKDHNNLQKIRQS